MRKLKEIDTYIEIRKTETKTIHRIDKKICQNQLSISQDHSWQEKKKETNIVSVSESNNKVREMRKVKEIDIYIGIQKKQTKTNHGMDKKICQNQWSDHRYQPRSQLAITTKTKMQ